MASATEIKDVFNPSVFEKIRMFWFQNAANDEELILPTMDLAKQWFTSDPAFDKLCRSVSPFVLTLAYAEIMNQRQL